MKQEIQKIRKFYSGEQSTKKERRETLNPDQIQSKKREEEKNRQKGLLFFFVFFFVSRYKRRNEEKKKKSISFVSSFYPLSFPFLVLFHFLFSFFLISSFEGYNSLSKFPEQKKRIISSFHFILFSFFSSLSLSFFFLSCHLKGTIRYQKFQKEGINHHYKIHQNLIYKTF